MTDEEFNDYFLPAVKNLILHLPANQGRAQGVINLMEELIHEKLSGVRTSKERLSEETKCRLKALAGPYWESMIATMRAKDKV